MRPVWALSNSTRSPRIRSSTALSRGTAFAHNTDQNATHIIVTVDGRNDRDASDEEALSLLVDRIRSAVLTSPFAA